MTTVQEPPLTLGDSSARQLANATKTTAQMTTITPRWLVHLLPWEPVEAGIYRLNKVRHPETVDVGCPGRDESELPQTFVDYEDHPREYLLNAVSTVVDVHTRVSDLYSSPYDQIGEQLRLTIETIKERQESELLNNPDYGMLANIADQQRITPLAGAPTPDDLDELITRVWKEPAFFLTHPRAIAAFGRECTRRGVPPATVSLFGSQFITWRGVPLIPSDKVPLEEGKTKVLLLRVGQERRGACVLVDGAQAVAHTPVDVQQLDPDFYVFSGHKVYGPTGIGVLYGKSGVLDTMPPWPGGGNMIRNVTFERSSYQPPPARFEAGTGSIADAAGLATAIGYVERIGRANIARYEHELLGYATRALTAVPGLRLVGTALDKAGILSFLLDGYRPEDVGSALNASGIAVRAGHHCAQPILRRYGLGATVRAALAMYNTRAEIDALASALHALTR